MVFSELNFKPARKHLVKRGELDEIVWKAAMYVVAAHHLQPFQATLSHLQKARNIARNVAGHWAPLVVGRISSRVPNLQRDLSAVRIVLQCGIGSRELIESKDTSEPVAVSPVVCRANPRILVTCC